jgi:hypothetical protein
MSLICADRAAEVAELAFHSDAADIPLSRRIVYQRLRLVYHTLDRVDPPERGQ